MQYQANTPDDYISQLPGDRKGPVEKLRQVIRKNLPTGFEETISYGMIGYVVPHARYPDGYHCDPQLPLPFINLASQKNYIAVYHNGMYADPELQQWFVEAYKGLGLGKPDMGKSCIRFKKPEKIPYDLIGQLCGKMQMDDWIELYEQAIKK
ncbi:DUF1801 domain-containing protein [Robiginitalea sp. SC105]|uniref:DUF1801 domain-containing protein n=1 Tax=Robiginitalea sp. SC105 TaxID=2762332 RepID=UPI00163998E5|nr:DUF1801 domain-containing protein [Robiginitalea sp. SC105]MBC2838530.1 DUF1801 domain-containing protein [Robiginitalea sp. SC105]